MSLAAAFADIALGFSAAGLGAYHDALAKWPGVAEHDDGGSIVDPGTPIALECSVQIDGVTEAMRLSPDYLDKDMRLLVLAATIEGEIDTSARIEMLAGPYAGTTWMVRSVARDPAGAAFECRGRAA